MNVDFLTAVKLFFANYVNFNGRSTRAEFWWVQLFCFIVALVLRFIPYVSGIWSLAIILPTLAITTRRLHDIGRSGWWLFGYYVIYCGILAICFNSLIPAMVQAAIDPQSATRQIVAAMQQNATSFITGGLIIFAMTVWYLIWMVKPSGPANQYGPNPYGE